MTIGSSISIRCAFNREVRESEAGGMKSQGRTMMSDYGYCQTLEKSSQLDLRTRIRSANSLRRSAAPSVSASSSSTVSSSTRNDGHEDFWEARWCCMADLWDCGAMKRTSASRRQSVIAASEGVCEPVMRASSSQLSTYDTIGWFPIGNKALCMPFSSSTSGSRLSPASQDPAK